MRSIVGFLAGLVLSSCAGHNENIPIEEIEPIEVRGATSDGAQIGLTEDGEAIIQDETRISDELRIQEMINARLEGSLDREYFELKRCRRDLSDPRLGGSGNLPPMVSLDALKDDARMKETFAKDEEGNLKIVRREMLMKRLKRERRFETTLRKISSNVTQDLEDCSYQLANARRGVGLPGKRIQPKGYYTEDGTWVETSPGESNLDDAFEITAKRKRKKSQDGT